MRDVDLKEPAPRSSTDPHLKWKALKALLFFAVAYSFIHKAAVPIFLKFTTLTRPEYAQLDLWVVPQVLLVLSLWSASQLKVRDSFLAGALVIHAVMEGFFAFSGHSVGWLQFSHLLSSWPVAGVCIAMLSWSASGRSLSRAWAGAASAAGLSVVLMGFDTEVKQVPISQMSRVLPDDGSAAWSTERCGSHEVYADLSASDVATRAERIEVMDCGFVPTRFWSEEDSVSVRNRLSRAINLHIVIRDASGSKRNLNHLLTAGAEHRFDLKGLRQDSAVVLFSDQLPDLGVSVVYRPGAQGRWHAQPKAPFLEFLP
jgi:hypothetical protein